MERPLSDIPSETLRFADLANRSANDFSLKPDADARAAIADALGVSALRKLSFIGSIAPEGSRDWTLTAKLGATVVQPCVVTLDPVTTRLDEDVLRRYLADMPEIDAIEIEMPEDDTAELIPANIDLYQVLIEALALALPLFPRADGAELDQLSVSEPGVTPMTDDDAKPFAGLGALKQALEDKDKK